jgi:hypothetical protein
VVNRGINWKNVAAYIHQSNAVLLQPARNVVMSSPIPTRDCYAYFKVRSLKDYEGDAKLSIDEIHMFPVEDADTIRNWVLTGKELYMSG